jgi:hypothetical protein
VLSTGALYDQAADIFSMPHTMGDTRKRHLGSLLGLDPAETRGDYRLPDADQIIAWQPDQSDTAAPADKQADAILTKEGFDRWAARAGLSLSSTKQLWVTLQRAGQSDNQNYAGLSPMVGAEPGLSVRRFVESASPLLRRQGVGPAQRDQIRALLQTSTQDLPTSEATKALEIRAWPPLQGEGAPPAEEQPDVTLSREEFRQWTRIAGIHPRAGSILWNALVQVADRDPQNFGGLTERLSDRSQGV